MARLIVEKGHEKGKSIPLPARTTTVFGRDTSGNVQIKDTMASRAHFKIEPRADGLWLVDLQSMNGTLLNGHPCREAKLNPGDLIRVGETMYSFIPDDAVADPLIGQRLGGYKLIERVGRGGMGTVYKAEQVDLQRIVALKIISEEHLKNPEFVELFVHEARAAAKLNHPNIVQVYDVKKTNELYYFSMEFVPGGSVQDLLNVKRKVPIADAVRMILEAARGLEYAHRKEIIHRDVKPDNFMLGEGGTIKIGDLGLAQRLGEKLSADNEDTVIGTPHFIAPEQVLGKPADVRSDVYALGSTMYRMIAGFTPFQAPSVRELVNKKAREDATPLHVALGGIPESLGIICAKMMARLPEERTQTMSDVIAALEAWTRAEAGGSAATPEAPPVSRKLLMSAVALLAVVVVGGVIAATAMLKKTDPPGPETVKPAPVADEGSPEFKYDKAALDEARLVDEKPDQFDDVIRQYDAIMARWPESDWGKKAERNRTALKTRRLALMAARGLASLDELSLETWKGLHQGFQTGSESLAEAEKRVKDYRAFADDPAWQGTEPSVAAGRRAVALTTWIEEVGKRRGIFEALKAKAGSLVGEMKYREAWEACNEFIAEVASYAPTSKDRYSTLLYDAPARRLLQQIVDQATAAVDAAATQAEALESKGDYAKAVELLEASVRYSLKDPADRAKKLVEEIHKRWSAANLKAEEMVKAEQRKLADLDRRDFDATAKRWREQILKFDPKSALADAQSIVKSSPDRFPRLPAAEARLASRIAPLRILAEFKDVMIAALNQNPPAVPNRITLDRLTGSIVRASDTHLTISLGPNSQIEPSFAEILSGGFAAPKTAQFLDYLRGAGKNAEPRWIMGLTILCLEFGLYERAAEEIKPLEKSTDDNVRKFLADVKPMTEDLRYPDSDEIEAQKHYDRLQLALKDPPASPRFDIARILLLFRTRFGGTDFYLAQKAKLDEIDKDRSEKDVREREKGVRAERYRKIRDARAAVQGNARAREAAITRGISNLKEPIERSYHYGESQCGFGNLGASTKALLESLDMAFRKWPSQEQRNFTDPNSVMVWAARAGGSLMRNFQLQKQEARGLDIRTKIDQKFEGGPDFFPWTAHKTSFVEWSQQAAERVKKYGDKLALAEKELQENPDAKTLYECAEAHDVLRNAVDARGLYGALMKEFPEHEKVKSGDALLRSAEMAYLLRDVTEAEALYQRMKTEYPSHPKVVAAGAFDSVDNRIKTCNSLKNNMGLSK